MRPSPRVRHSTPRPQVIEARTERLELLPGLDLVMVPKATRGAIVQLVLSLHLGDLESLKGRSRAGELAARMLMRGTQKRSRQEIQDELDRLKAQLRIFGGATSAQARLEVPREHLQATLSLLAEILRQPSFPASELGLLKQEELARLENSKSDPFQMAFTTFQRHLRDWPEDDPRHVETPEERIAKTQKTTLEDVRSFYTDLYGASAVELSAVGDFDPEELTKQVAELFKGWESAKPYTRISSPYRETTPLVKSLEAPDKESAVFVAGLPIEVQDTDPDYPALMLGNFMTGGGFLNSRLAMRLRQKEGLSYGVRSNFSASSWEKDATFLSYAIYAPQNAAKLEAAFKEEIAKILDEGFTADEIAPAKQGWLQRRKVSRSQERELASRLASLQHRQRTLAWEAELESRVQALTAEDILKAMRRHIDLKKMSMVKAGDFARVKETKETEREPDD